MIEEPRDWDNLMGKFIWPDRVIYRQKDDGTCEAIFIVDKGNNRGLTTDKVMLIRLFELLNIPIMLCYGGALLTLDEFNSGQGYRINAVGRSMQQVYNARADLKVLENELLTHPPESFVFQQLEKKIAAKRRILDSIDRPVQQSIASALNPRENRMNFMANQGRLLKELREQGKTEEEINEALTQKKKEYEASL